MERTAGADSVALYVEGLSNRESGRVGLNNGVKFVVYVFDSRKICFDEGNGGDGAVFEGMPQVGEGDVEE
jgi:hypothetical protein